MGFLKKSNNTNFNTPKGVNETIIKDTPNKKSKHEFKTLSVKDVKENRSSAYDFLVF